MKPLIPFASLKVGKHFWLWGSRFTKIGPLTAIADGAKERAVLRPSEMVELLLAEENFLGPQEPLTDNSSHMSDKVG